MITAQTNGSSGGDFLLSKWFLDFVGDEGEAMIFYAAKLKWHGWSVSYASWLRYNPASGVLLKSRFQDVCLPVVEDNLIKWNDPIFGVSGTWRSMADRIKTRLFDSEEGCVEWNCYQPASKVQLKIKDKILNGRGYAEQLIMTVLPWKIPMDELRWGRFGSENMNMVWIELVGKENQKWLWVNGELMHNFGIKDNYLSIPEKSLILNLDRGVVLEAEKKISAVAGKLIRYIPGINSLMPLHFLMADETKWLSRGLLLAGGEKFADGMAIHEIVNFRPLL